MDNDANEANEEAAMKVIEMAQRLHRKLHLKLAQKGIEPIDVLIASAYATHELAAIVTGSPSSAIEWMRSMGDRLERQILPGGS